ncbi:hypothetical protein VC83_07088 [Pseudogymnoascus destructans]|uniref:BHLH domain-containing protein n=2 Tax=Pseudogymnoascus destructans TaxID=655981 RepID=L8FW27_PSED2|nr:uncharacterized protein VC83_07088 [Pseudogymnoascus destructans]ELR04663.1 hypothetical protein GMDG_01522 [Pseudogymnoascus destructans 20631-21]OAF56782.1 hypothetical protein VC83_07088 [Pseudogymnoascus destructans]
MSSMPQHNYMIEDPLSESPGMLGEASIFFHDGMDEEELFLTPLNGDNMLQFNEQPWQNPDIMTGNSTSAQSWPVSADMTRNDSSATSQSHQSNQSFNFPATAEEVQTTALRSVELPLKTSASPSPASLLASTSTSGMRTRKRKTSPLTDDDEEEDGTPESPPQKPPMKKTAHNMIEKRYRTNLNDKIAALRQSVPSLRATEKNLGAGGKGARNLVNVMEDLDGLIPPNKLNKATILSKATEYIGHLERRNKSLQSEKASLLDRISTFENLLLGRKHHGQQIYHPDQLLMQQHQMMDRGNANQRPNRN